MGDPFTGPRFDAVSAWDALSPEVQRAIGVAALNYIHAIAGVEERDTDHDRPFRAAEQVAYAELLHTIEEEVWPSGEKLPLPSIVGPICRECGCSDNDACGLGCRWVEQDLCSACVGASS